jgi:hypothetical protein
MSLLYGNTNAIVTINSEVVTQTPTGGASIASYTAKATNVPMQIEDMKPDECSMIYGAFDPVKYKRGLTTVDYGIVPTTDYVVWNGDNYQVHSVQTRVGRYFTVYQLDLVLKPGGQ